MLLKMIGLAGNVIRVGGQVFSYIILTWIITKFFNFIISKQAAIKNNVFLKEGLINGIRELVIKAHEIEGIKNIG